MFRRGEAEQLRQYLQETEEHTQLRHVDDPVMLQLTPEGTTIRDGWRLTFAAFKQAAHIMGPGLSIALPDIAGTTVSPRNVNGLVDRSIAVRLWNDLVALRYPLFSRFRVIHNARERLIEGFVGTAHQYLENVSLYAEAMELLRQYRPQAEFYAARIVSRRLSLWLRDVQPTFTVMVDEKPWAARLGYYFTNGEATGTSVRGTVALFLPCGVCLGPYQRYGRRVSHKGRDFTQRLGTMFAEVYQSELPVEPLRAGLQTMVTTSLGFTEPGEQFRQARKKKLVHAMSLLGITKSLAAEALDAALATGRHGGTVLAELRHPEQYARRTVLDLLVPLLHLARRVDLLQRERVEQAAFNMVLGRLLL